MESKSHSYCPTCLTTFRGEDPENCPNLSCGIERPDEGWGRVHQPGDMIDRHYKVEQVLAVGGAGLTYRAREVDRANDPTGPALAVKVLYSARASGAYLQRLATEAQILQELSHEHIVECRGFVHRSGHEPYLVTLFEEGGSLAHRIKRGGTMTPMVAAAVLKQILLALDTAHQRGVVHRDLKPDNVLLSGSLDEQDVPHVRVADFGIAKVVGGLSSRITKLGTFVGTPEYAAPEQFEQQGATAATDVFACGGLLYFMLTGSPPITLSRRADIEASYTEMLAQLPPALTPDQLPDASTEQLLQLNEILFHTMVARSEYRWTAHQVIAALGRVLGIEPGLGHQTLEVTHEPAPKRRGAPGSPSTARVPAASTKDGEATTQPFLTPDKNDADTGTETDPDGTHSDHDAPEAASELEASQVEVPQDAPATSSPEPAAERAAAPESPKPVSSSEPPASAPSSGRWVRRAALLVLVLGLTGLVGGGLASLGGLAIVGISLETWLTPSAPPDPMPQPHGSESDWLTGKDRRRIQVRLQKAVRGTECRAAGPVVLTVDVDDAGVVGSVKIDPGYVRDSATEKCVERVISERSLGRGTASGRARVALVFD